MNISNLVQTESILFSHIIVSYAAKSRFSCLCVASSSSFCLVRICLVILGKKQSQLFSPHKMVWGLPLLYLTDWWRNTLLLLTKIALKFPHKALKNGVAFQLVFSRCILMQASLVVRMFQRWWSKMWMVRLCTLFLSLAHAMVLMKQRLGPLTGPQSSWKRKTIVN